MSTSVFCLAQSDHVAHIIVDKLRVAGFHSGHVSVLFPSKAATKEFAIEKHTKAPEGAAAGGVAGGVVGGALGWLVGIGMLTIPGVGLFLAAGPIMAALGGAAVGATVGGLTGALIGLGVPELEAKRYESKIREGRILISVQVKDTLEADRARDIFKHEGAEFIASASVAKHHHHAAEHRHG